MPLRSPSSTPSLSYSTILISSRFSATLLPAPALQRLHSLLSSELFYHRFFFTKAISIAITLSSRFLPPFLNSDSFLFNRVDLYYYLKLSSKKKLCIPCPIYCSLLFPFLSISLSISLSIIFLRFMCHAKKILHPRYSMNLTLLLQLRC